MGNGWGALIPCDMPSLPARCGTSSRALDSEGDASRPAPGTKHPFRVLDPAGATIASAAPHLPGRAAPQTCDENTPEPAHGEPSEGPAEHPARHEQEREPEEEAPERPVGPLPYAHWWVGAAGAVDLLALPGGSDLCALTSSATPANGSGYYCTNPNGSDFPARVSGPQATLPSSPGKPAPCPADFTPAVCASSWRSTTH